MMVPTLSFLSSSANATATSANNRNTFISEKKIEIINKQLDNHCYPYICPRHCKDSHMHHMKNGSKSNTNSKPIFTENLNYLTKKNMLTMVDTSRLSA